MLFHVKNVNFLFSCFKTSCIIFDINTDESIPSIPFTYCSLYNIINYTYCIMYDIYVSE